MTSRDAFLADLRRALAGHQAPPAPEGVPEVRYAGAGTGPDGFAAAWTALGGHVHHATTAGLPDAVAAIAGERRPLLAGPGPLLTGVPADERWPACGIAGAARAAVGVCEAVAAVAATGSVVVDSTRGRSVSLLPPAAIFVIPPGQVVDTPAAVLRHHADWWPDGLPSQLMLVTGPSRSADIEQTLITGVHGPGEVHAILLS